MKNKKVLIREELSKMIDHTKLDITATVSDIEILCEEAINYGFGAVCVRSDKVGVAKNYLVNSDVKIASVVGFPGKKCLTLEEMVEELSTYLTKNKVIEAREAVLNGADEIDMVVDLGSVKMGNYEAVRKDIEYVVKASGVPVKVIIETCYLTDEEKEEACRTAEIAGAGFVKTSTGYGTGGAMVGDVKLMGKVVSENVGIKASGGIRTARDALELYKASQKYKKHEFRIGASSGKEIIK